MKTRISDGLDVALAGVLIAMILAVVAMMVQCGARQRPPAMPPIGAEPAPLKVPTGLPR